MALSSLLSPLLLLLAVLIHTASISPVYAQIDHASLQLMTEALEWPSTLSIQDEFSVIDASGRPRHEQHRERSTVHVLENQALLHLVRSALRESDPVPGPIRKVVLHAQLL
ncbi:ralf-like 34 [Actinidia rufa]|uniref:Ralf-like 34 n=1 Tax=Actinidia rufa TaxID=165716 RepID=A0A7J0D9X0_9ERIC|nr:ralf-like 34 [Actinidia rufa]